MTAVVGKLFAALDCIAAEGNDAVGLAQLTQRTRLPKATLYRLLCDLVDAGVVEHSKNGYSLGGRLFELGFAVPRYRRLRQQAMPFLEDLQAEIGETVHLGVLMDEKVVILEKLFGRSQVRVPTTVGSRHALYSTAMGKILLAHSMPDVIHRILGSLEPVTRRTVIAPGLLSRQLGRFRHEGVALEAEETYAGIGCVAAPLTGPDGAIAAISVAGNPRKVHTSAVQNRVRQVACRLSLSLDAGLAAS
ncbi:IclR family transcriptional regulator [Nocardia sp. NPDC050799]|uniref:IclR family transcriptional regulator n=1 Tax=Nocardia sp. NPDC050799 TaxID=3154842 RepID=UPI0033E92406